MDGQAKRSGVVRTVPSATLVGPERDRAVGSRYSESSRGYSSITGSWPGSCVSGTMRWAPDVLQQRAARSTSTSAASRVGACRVDAALLLL